MVSEFASLDGILEEPRWRFQFPWSGEVRTKFKNYELSDADALLLGRVTCEGFAEARPFASGTVLPRYKLAEQAMEQ